jgi:D-beta-D-heptose 7-phosphate kinase/D-beta-D-heptose 1-phosphate adenosyltransferase
MVAFGEANGLRLEHTIELANISSGIAIERLGCASIQLSEIVKVLLEKDPSGKIYEEVGESFVFQQSLENHPIVLLNLEEAEAISMSIFHQIREVAKRKNEAKLVILIKPSETNRDFVHLLASMHEVDFVLSTRDGLESLIEKLQPQEVWSGL